MVLHVPAHTLSEHYLCHIHSKHFTKAENIQWLWTQLRQFLINRTVSTMKATKTQVKSQHAT